jgi:hypothetical protein
LTEEIDILNKGNTRPTNHKMSLPRSLSITIPKEELSIDELIQRLRYLETPVCRNLYSEEQRKEEIRLTTIRFKKALQVKEFFDQVTKTESVLFN